MSANPIPDPSQQPITSDDPRVQQILALIRARQQPIAPDPSQQSAPQIPQPSPIQQAVQPPDAGPPPPVSNLPPMGVSTPPQFDAPAAPVVTQKPGPVKSFLQSLVSGLGGAAYQGTQGALERLGLPTDYSKQQDAAKLAIAQQTANDNSSYRQALTDLTAGKSAQLDQLMSPYTIDQNDQSVLPQFRGLPTTFGGYQNLQKLSPVIQGKTGVAQIGADAKTTAATTGATAKIDVANIAAAAKALQTSQKQSSGSGAVPTGTPAELATAIAQGHVPIDRMGYLLARNPGLIQSVMAADPSFDGSKAMAYPATYKDFTSGKTSVAINAGGTVLQHLLTLQSLNTPESRIPGTADYQAYENQLATIAPELGKFYGNDTIPGIEGYKKTLGAILNRGAAIQTQAHSMGVKLDNYQQQWNNAAPSKAYQAPLPGISPAAMAARAALDPTYKVPSGTPATSTAPARPAGVPANAQWNAQGNNGHGQWEAQ